MSKKTLVNNEHQYFFGTKGLTIEDIEGIGLIYDRYGVNSKFSTRDHKFDEIDGFIEYVRENECSTLHFLGEISKTNLVVSLSVIGALSSWTVGKPNQGTPEEWAISQQVFLEVQEILEKRREFIPDVPWNVAKNSLTIIPLVALSIRSFAFEEFLTDSRVLRLTIAVAAMSFAFAFIERRRWYRTAISKKKSIWGIVKSRWPEVAVALVVAIVIEVLVRIFEVM